MTFPDARAILDSAIKARAFPAAAIEVGRASGPLWSQALGALTYDPDAAPTTLSTRFDLASLTKVIATASIVMQEVAGGRLTIDAPLAGLLPAWRAREQDGITIRHLLDHSSGLPAHLRFWEHDDGRDAIAEEIAGLPLDHPPGTRAVYSDLGFMVLGFLLEEIIERPLDDRFLEIARAIDADTLEFTPDTQIADDIAPTEQDPWRGRLLIGEVHDENAAVLGGVAGHAGLFGTVGDVGAFARLVLETFRQRTILGSPELMRQFASRSATPGSSRALGWDTMLPTSSCGTLMSPSAIGHVGFTGTSLWIDWERDLYVALLTNRVHPTRENAALVAIRPQIHDAVVAALTR